MVRARSMRHALFAIGMVMAIGACASGGGGEAPRRGSATRITAEELASYASEDLQAIIYRLRPRWLQSRGSSTGRSNVAIFIDGVQQAGGVDLLHAYRGGDVQEVSYLSATDATTRFGTNMDGGAILVVTRH